MICCWEFYNDGKDVSPFHVHTNNNDCGVLTIFVDNEVAEKTADDDEDVAVIDVSTSSGGCIKTWCPELLTCSFLGICVFEHSDSTASRR